MDRMFMNIEMAEVVRQCERAAEKMVAEFTEPQLLANSLEELVDAVVTEKVPRAIAFDAGHHRIGTQVVPTPRGQIFGVPHPQRGGQDPAESVKVSLHIPWSGTRQAFTFRPHHSLQINPEGTFTERDVILSVVVYPGTPGDIAQKYVLDQEHNLLQWVDRVNGDIAQLEHQIRGMVRSRIAERRDILQQRDAMATAFTIPIRQAEPDRALQIPVRRTTIVLRGSSPAGTGGQPEWSITDAVYEQTIWTITSFSHALERRPASATKLLPDEETLRDWLMFVLGTNYEAPDGGEIFVGGETVNGKGKTDILIRHQAATPSSLSASSGMGQASSMRPSSNCSATPSGGVPRQGDLQSRLCWSWGVIQAEDGQEQGGVVFDFADCGGDFGISGMADQADREVTQGGHDAGAGPGADAGGVLAVGDVADPVDWASHCSFTVRERLEQPVLGAGSSIRRPFLRPARMWTARSSPRLTRCNTVCRETPRLAVATWTGTQPAGASSATRSRMDRVRRMRQGAPGVICSPGTNPSLSHL
jgi:hypothetical protein